MKRSGGVPGDDDSAPRGGSDQCGKAASGAKQPTQLRTVPTGGLATSPLRPPPWPGPARADEARLGAERSGPGSAPPPPPRPPSWFHVQGLTVRSCSLTSA
ncbi:acrosin-like [Harpia harpyja]|uniref:acrosin-like n=1 Tax=Harpia harpyja TaxID=202280 RepID=UPI0022B1F77E|nr:acrosin-like [Harpia harpyja]